MDIQNFEKELEKLNLSKKEFAGMTSLPYQTIMNWKRSDSLPKWVRSWLENYIKAKDIDKMAEAMKPYMKCEE